MNPIPLFDDGSESTSRRQGRHRDRWCLKGSGIFWKELARYFSISRPSVLQAIKPGKKFAKEDGVNLLN
jgi:hypothetical protein